MNEFIFLTIQLIANALVGHRKGDQDSVDTASKIVKGMKWKVEEMLNGKCFEYWRRRFEM